MPFLQPATANYFGFMPAMVGMGPIRTTNYLVSSSCAAIYKSDAVGLTSEGFIAPYLQSSYPIVGIAANSVNAGDGSTSADIRVASSKTCLVYDDPGTLFVSCDTTSGVIGGTSMIFGTHVDILSTGAVGSTGPNGTLLQSVQAISGVTASTGTALLPFTVVALHPIESALSTVATATAAATSQVRKFILQPFHHAYALKTTST